MTTATEKTPRRLGTIHPGGSQTLECHRPKSQSGGVGQTAARNVEIGMVSPDSEISDLGIMQPLDKMD